MKARLKLCNRTRKSLLSVTKENAKEVSLNIHNGTEEYLIKGSKSGLQLKPLIKSAGFSEEYAETLATTITEELTYFMDSVDQKTVKELLK